MPLGVRVTSTPPGGSVPVVEDEVLPGDLDAGDVLMLPGTGHKLLVKAVRLGQGGFLLTVSPVDDDAPEAERFITLTAATHLRRRG
jgi:hypothetical protein